MSCKLDPSSAHQTRTLPPLIKTSWRTRCQWNSSTKHRKRWPTSVRIPTMPTILLHSTSAQWTQLCQHIITYRGRMRCVLENTRWELTTGGQTTVSKFSPSWSTASQGSSAGVGWSRLDEPWEKVEWSTLLELLSGIEPKPHWMLRSSLLHSQLNIAFFLSVIKDYTTSKG